MKKIIYLLGIGLMVNYAHSTVSPSSGEERFNHELEILKNQLDKIVLNPLEQNNLLKKLKSYFDPELAVPALNNKKTEVLYSSIINSYQKLLINPKKINRDEEPLAERFKEQALAKILFHKNKLIIRKKSP